jgi:autoinducer 2-degrading protein
MTGGAASPFAVVVMFKVSPDNASGFQALLEENAAASVDGEPGCLRFDIVRLDGGDLLLYELCSDRSAFDAHLDSPHFKAFDEATRAHVLEKAIWTGSSQEPHKRPQS